MRRHDLTRREFLRSTVATGTAAGLFGTDVIAALAQIQREDSIAVCSPADVPTAEPQTQAQAAADYTLRIGASAIEIAPKHMVSTITYNGKFPGPLLRFKEGREAAVEIHNDTDAPEQLHWHGQMVSTEVDGAAEEGTPYIQAHGMRRITFTPRPAGLRFYHTHRRAGADLHAGQYSGQVGAVYIEAKDEPGRHDREVFLVLKEFEGSFSKGGDMPQDFLSPPTKVKELEEAGESAMKASVAKGMPHGYEVGYQYFTINGRMLGHGEPVRVKTGEHVLFHVVNGSATELRSLALPGHAFRVVALDGNPVPRPAEVPALWLGPGERISAVVEMKQPGVWILGDLADDDRRHGMGMVVEYAGQKGKPAWTAPKPFPWSYARFGAPNGAAREPDETIEMTFAKRNAAENGFNQWAVNEQVFSHEKMAVAYPLRQGKRYRLPWRKG